MTAGLHIGIHRRPIPSAEFVTFPILDIAATFHPFAGEDLRSANRGSVAYRATERCEIESLNFDEAEG
jgi:hypothetical protein